MNTPPLRCGIVGTGTFAAEHARAIKEIPALQLAAACDVDAERCAAFVRTWEGNAYGDCATLLTQEKPDIVSVCTPDDTHAAVIERMLRHPHAPRLLIVEKPLCTSPEHLRSITALPKDMTDRIVVDHTRRFIPAFEKLRRRIAAGEWGELLSVHWRYYAGWMRNGVHIVDLIRMLFGECTCRQASVQCVDRYPHDPLLDVTLQSERYPRATIRVEGIPEHPYQILEGECFFERGRLRIHFDDVFIDTLKPGYAGAESLEFCEHVKVESTLEALTALYASGAAFLKDGTRNALDGANLAEARATMQVLFDARATANL